MIDTVHIGRGGPVTREMVEAFGRKLTDAEAAMLEAHLELGPLGQPRLVIDQQSFQFENDGQPWARDRAVWYCKMLAIALARLVDSAVAEHDKRAGRG